MFGDACSERRDTRYLVLEAEDPLVDLAVRVTQESGQHWLLGLGARYQRYLCHESDAGRHHHGWYHRAKLHQCAEGGAGLIYPS